ncbi:MAG: glycine--tRNA ligase subunit beta [Candidatus Omnitrophica bacterium]|nr:glycine--tRNA ligase subunit beta [Candidatus Omnitrophota bacterium]
MKRRTPVSRLLSPVSRATDLLLEIGTEELPAAYLPGLIEQLGREAATLLQAHHLPYERAESAGTPRRLVLIVRGLSATQRKPAEEVRGPSKQAAYDKDGKPTAALLGFLRAQGGSLAHTKVVSSERGDYVYLVKEPRATPASAVLPELLPQLIGRLRAPKTMRWDASGVRFARPIRWLLALYGTSALRCSLGTLQSASATRVGGPLRPRAVRVRSLEGYLRTLKQAGVALDQAQRRAWIEQAVGRIAGQARGAAAPEMVSHGLLDEVTHLVERPTPLAGRFDRTYLSLPREVLLASMAKYQRVFAVEAGGTLLPQFIAILEGPPRRPAEVRKVMERILNARLADSLLFWIEDHQRLPLQRMAEALSGVTFHERLGSMAEKTVRLRALAEPLAEAWQLTEEERAHLRRACQLAKADLVSTMVKEFPTLQGVIGKHYARDSEEPAPVAEAIEEQYLPAGNQRPRTLLGGALALLDKYDTLSSYFGLGIMPTGDQDPFGLRRAAQGIVEIAWTVHRPLPLGALFRTRTSMEPFRSVQPRAAATAGNQVQRYLLDRLDTFEWPTPAPAPDTIDAVLAGPCDDLVDVMDRIVTLQGLHNHPALRKAAKVIERTRNILRGAALRQPQVDPARLAEAPERQLWELYRAHEPRLAGLAQDKAYAEATTLFGEVFFEPLHRFFDQVMVNVPDEALQQNRLALMQAIQALYTDRIADLSKLTLLHHEEPAA